MKMRFVPFLVLVIAVLNPPEHAMGQEAVSLYHSERGRFSLSIPPAWEKQEQDMGQGVWGLIAQSPDEATSDFFSENINIVIVPADTTDLSEANRRGIEILKRNMAQFTLLDQAVGKIGPHSASWFIHTFSYEGHTLKLLQYTLINGNKMYIATCTALPETFDRYRPVFENIVASIAFDEPATPRASPTTPVRSDGNSFNVASKLGAVIGAIVGFYALFRALRRKK